MFIRLSKITMFLIMFVSISYIICFANTVVIRDAEQVWETQFSSNNANSCDRTVTLTSDNDGNIYVAGRSTSQPYGVDYLITKYNQVGTLLWEARYNGIGNGEDLVEDIQVDNNGNVYVTGASLGDGTGYNIATVKYDSNGIQQWEAIWTGTSDTDYDFGHTIAIDNSGNIYVAGVTGFLGSSTEFIILKYNNNGEQEWEELFDGVVQVKDQAPNITIDSEDYIYVTGSSQGQTSLDYTIIKYNQEGEEQWAAFYNSPANLNDELHATILDDSGNIYVTGASFNQNYSTDIKTVKFNSDGIFQWEASFNGSGDYDDDGRDIAIDSEGNIFVIGWSANSNFLPEYVTLKYDSSGTLLWSASYDGEMGCENYANALALDNLGNVIVTGSSMNANGVFDYTTVKYDTNGNEEWVAIYDSPVEKDDQANGITVTENSIWVMGLSEKGPSDYDYSVIKYDYSGNEQIIVNYNGPGSSVDKTTKLAFSESGYLYAIGSSLTAATNKDFLTVKYDLDGNIIWSTNYNGPANGVDELHDVVIDNMENIIVTGISAGLGSGKDIATIKYDANGNEIWLARYNGAGNDLDSPSNIGVDALGNIYIMGTCTNSSGNSDYIVIKYSATGVEQWIATYDGPVSGVDYGNAGIVDDSGCVYITGTSENIGFNMDIITVKFDSNGMQLWEATYNGPANDGDYGESITIDEEGNVYLTGYSINNTFTSDYITIKYSSDGIEQWSNIYNGYADDSDEARDIKVDLEGNVYITGMSFGDWSTNFFDFATVKYDAAGNEQWVALYDGAASGDEANALEIDSQGNIYVTGSSTDVNGCIEYATVKYDSSGNEKWIARYAGVECLYDMGEAICNDIVIDNSENIYVTGYIRSYLGWSISSTLKYDQLPVFSDENMIPSINYLFQNYPNPFNPTTTINYNLKAAADVELEIFNLKGQKVTTLVNEHKVAGQHKAVWNGKDCNNRDVSSGVYFYKMKADKDSEMKKMLLLK